MNVWLPVKLTLFAVAPEVVAVSVVPPINAFIVPPPVTFKFMPAGLEAVIEPVVAVILPAFEMVRSELCVFAIITAAPFMAAPRLVPTVGEFRVTFIVAATFAPAMIDAVACPVVKTTFCPLRGADVVSRAAFGTVRIKSEPADEFIVTGLPTMVTAPVPAPARLNVFVMFANPEATALIFGDVTETAPPGKSEEPMLVAACKFTVLPARMLPLGAKSEAVALIDTVPPVPNALMESPAKLDDANPGQFVDAEPMVPVRLTEAAVMLTTPPAPPVPTSPPLDVPFPPTPKAPPL